MPKLEHSKATLCTLLLLLVETLGLVGEVVPLLAKARNKTKKSNVFWSSYE